MEAFQLHMQLLGKGALVMNALEETAVTVACILCTQKVSDVPVNTTSCSSHSKSVSLSPIHM